MKIIRRGRTRIFTHQIVARITERESNVLRYMCKKLHKNRSQIIRQAIEEYYRQIYDDEI